MREEEKTVTLWLSNARSQEEYARTGKISQCVAAFYDDDMTAYGWVRAGEIAVKDITFSSGKGLREAKVERLKEEIKRVKADAGKRIMELEDRMASLMALSCDGKEC